MNNTYLPNVSDASSIDYNNMSAKELLILCAESLDTALRNRMKLEDNAFFPSWLPFFDTHTKAMDLFDNIYVEYVDFQWYSLSHQEQVLGYLFFAEIYS